MEHGPPTTIKIETIGSRWSTGSRPPSIMTRLSSSSKQATPGVWIQTPGTANINIAFRSPGTAWPEKIKMKDPEKKNSDANRSERRLSWPDESIIQSVQIFGQTFT
jgi:hypothetical protein